LSSLKEYHFTWLSVHPWRSAKWLEGMLTEGFDIHHLDGNHANNAPENLVLIDHADHMMLHGSPRAMLRFNKGEAKRAYNLDPDEPDVVPVRRITQPKKRSASKHLSLEQKQAIEQYMSAHRRTWGEKSVYSEADTEDSIT